MGWDLTSVSDPRRGPLARLPEADAAALIAAAFDGSWAVGLVTDGLLPDAYSPDDVEAAIEQLRARVLR